MRLTFLMVFVPAIFLGVGSADADELLVSRASFAGAIRDREPAPALQSNQHSAPGSLWFWSEIRVDKNVMGELRLKKRLPLQHRWYRNIAGTPGPDERPDFYRDLEEVDEKKIKAFAAAAEEQGFFMYRTSSCRVDLRAGRWTAKVTDARGNSLKCADGSRCRFEIVVDEGGQKALDICKLER